MVSPVGEPAAGPISVIKPNALRREHLEKYTFAMQTAFSQRLSQCIFAAKLTKLIQNLLFASFCQMLTHLQTFAKLWRACSRLYRSRFCDSKIVLILQYYIFKGSTWLYNVCALFHRSQVNILQIFGRGKPISVKFEQALCVRKNCIFYILSLAIF